MPPKAIQPSLQCHHPNTLLLARAAFLANLQYIWKAAGTDRHHIVMMHIRPRPGLKAWKTQNLGGLDRCIGPTIGVISKNTFMYFIPLILEIDHLPMPPAPVDWTNQSFLISEERSTKPETSGKDLLKNPKTTEHNPQKALLVRPKMDQQKHQEPQKLNQRTPEPASIRKGHRKPPAKRH